jgi:hypothetical protein
MCVAVLTGGCASFNAGTDYRPTPNSDRGLAVFSLTGSGIGYFNIKFRKTPGEKESFAPSGGTGGPKPDWINPTGRLVAIELDAGEYEFFAWEDHFGAGPSQSMATIVPSPNDPGKLAIRSRLSKTPFSVRFRVSSGAVTYLGNVHLELTSDSYTVRVFDRSDRDLPLFHERYSRIRSAEVQKSLSIAGRLR